MSKAGPTFTSRQRRATIRQLLPARAALSTVYLVDAPNAVSRRVGGLQALFRAFTGCFYWDWRDRGASLLFRNDVRRGAWEVWGDCAYDRWGDELAAGLPFSELMAVVAVLNASGLSLDFWT
jgi:hypothetical protein